MINTIYTKRVNLDYQYAVEKPGYNSTLETMTKEELIELIKFTDHQRFTDPNYSQAAENVTMKSAGMNPHNWRDKHGLDSVEENGEGKPCKLSLEGTRKFDGSFSFCDMSLNKIETLYSNNTKIVHAGFIEGELVFSISVPMGNDSIKNELISSYNAKNRKGQRKVLTVSRGSYCEDKNVELNYVHPDLWKYKHKFRWPFYDMLCELEYKKSKTGPYVVLYS